MLNLSSASSPANPVWDHNQSISNQGDDERYLEFRDNQEDNNQDVGSQGEDEGYLGFGNNQEVNNGVF